MTVKRINSVLTATAVGCCAVAVVAVLAALLLPLDLGGALDGTASTSPNRKPPTTLPSGDAGDAFLARALRTPMSDNVATDTATAPQAAAGPQSMALVGTIGDALALIRLPDGSVVARGVGDEVGDGSVVAIGSKGVEVLVNGQHVLLSKPQPATSTGVIVERES